MGCISEVMDIHTTHWIHFHPRNKNKKQARYDDLRTTVIASILSALCRAWRMNQKLHTGASYNEPQPLPHAINSVSHFSEDARLVLLQNSFLQKIYLQLQSNGRHDIALYRKKEKQASTPNYFSSNKGPNKKMWDTRPNLHRSEHKPSVYVFCIFYYV